MGLLNNSTHNLYYKKLLFLNYKKLKYKSAILDIRKLNSLELEQFLNEYIYSLIGFYKIKEPYENLIANAKKDHEIYYKKKLEEFEDWKYNAGKQNLHKFENNERLQLIEKRDKKSIPKFLLAIIGFIIGFIAMIITFIFNPFQSDANSTPAESARTIFPFLLTELVGILLPIIFIILFWNYYNIKNFYIIIKLRKKLKKQKKWMKMK